MIRPQTLHRHLMQVQRQAFLIIRIYGLQFHQLIRIAGMTYPRLPKVAWVIEDDQFLGFGLPIGEVGHSRPGPKQRLVTKPALLSGCGERSEEVVVQL